MREMKVLLVDDEVDFVKTLSKRLQMRDLKTDTVYDGEQAVSFAKEQEPDVMVLDLRMPGMDGMEVLRQIKKAYPKTQVIILTAHGTEKDKEEAEKLGIFDFLKKPVDIETLVDKIKAAYKKKLELTMSAIAFAEEGEFDTAREIMKNEENNKSKPGGE
ncbi:MAG: response regulator [Nitrospirota bacterium]|nr:response regulator [Nitrospirota bacterium]MDH5768770.1 response regulator [Nitrospirota bacterium]